MPLLYLDPPSLPEAHFEPLIFVLIRRGLFSFLLRRGALVPFPRNGTTQPAARDARMSELESSSESDGPTKKTSQGGPTFVLRQKEIPPDPLRGLCPRKEGFLPDPTKSCIV